MSLKNLRKKINSIDTKIVALLNDRAQMSLAIGKEKLKTNKSVYSPDREKEVLRHVREVACEGPLGPDAIGSLAVAGTAGRTTVDRQQAFAHNQEAPRWRPSVPLRPIGKAH